MTNIIYDKTYKYDGFDILFRQAYDTPWKAEPDSRKVITNLVRNNPDWVVYDCGAHIGLYTAMLGMFVKEVHAFEPTDTFKMLDANISYLINQDLIKTDVVNLHRIAVGNFTGTSSDPIWKIWKEVKEETNRYWISLDCFTSYLKPERIDLIKIDVDSYDYEVLLGATETINVYKPLILVETNDALKLRGYCQEEVRVLMCSKGYKLVDRYDNDNELWEPK